MGGCVNKMSSADVSPERHSYKETQEYKNRSRDLKRSPKKSKQEQMNMLSWTEVLEANKGGAVTGYQNNEVAIDNQIQEYRLSTQARIISKRQGNRLSKNEKKEVKGKASSEVNLGVANLVDDSRRRVNKEQFYVNSSIKRSPQLILGSLQKKQVGENKKEETSATRKKRGTRIPWQDQKENSMKNTGCYCSKQQVLTSDGSLPELALNDETDRKSLKQVKTEDISQPSEMFIVRGSTNHLQQDQELINQKKYIQTFDFQLPRFRGGPLIVSRLAYELYAV